MRPMFIFFYYYYYSRPAIEKLVSISPKKKKKSSCDGRNTGEINASNNHKQADTYTCSTQVSKACLIWADNSLHKFHSEPESLHTSDDSRAKF